MTDELGELRARIRQFSADRDWDQFHTPRNLILALVGEVGELAAEIQWLSDEQLPESLEEPGLRESFSSEMADVLIYLIRRADVCDIDLLKVADQKVTANETRYPVHRSRGRPTKYTKVD